MNVEQPPFQGMLGGYFEYQRPHVSFTDVNPVTSSSTNNEDEELKKKKLQKETTPQLPTNHSTSEYMSDPIKNDDNDPPSKSFSDMTLEELENEKSQLDWVHRNIGGVNTQRDNKNKVAPQHVLQTALGASIPFLGLATGLVNYVAEQRLEGLNEEIAKRQQDSDVKKTVHKHGKSTSLPHGNNIMHDHNFEYNHAEKQSNSPSSFWDHARSDNIHNNVETSSYEGNNSSSSHRDEIDFF